MSLARPTEAHDTHLPVLGHGVPHSDLARPTEGGQLTADEEQVVDDHRHLELAWRRERHGTVTSFVELTSGKWIHSLIMHKLI